MIVTTSDRTLTLAWLISVREMLFSHQRRVASVLGASLQHHLSDDCHNQRDDHSYEQDRGLVFSQEPFHRQSL